jgi:hypothetical protein
MGRIRIPRTLERRYRGKRLMDDRKSHGFTRYWRTSTSEEITAKNSKRKDCGKEEQFRDFSSIDRYWILRIDNGGGSLRRHNILFFWLPAVGYSIRPLQFTDRDIRALITGPSLTCNIAPVGPSFSFRKDFLTSFFCWSDLDFSWWTGCSPHQETSFTLSLMDPW